MTGPDYDPKLPDDIALNKRSGGMPRKLRHEADIEESEAQPQPASEIPVTAQPATDETRQEQEDMLADRAEASLTTPGEELRPKDGTVDPADAR